MGLTIYKHMMCHNALYFIINELPDFIGTNEVMYGYLLSMIWLIFKL